jgi:hypothetical protein
VKWFEQEQKPTISTSADVLSAFPTIHQPPLRLWSTSNSTSSLSNASLKKMRKEVEAAWQKVVVSGERFSRKESA